MFHKLRKRFLRMTSMILLSLLLIVIVSINVMNLYANLDTVETMIQLIQEYDGVLPNKRQVRKELRRISSNQKYDLFFPGKWGNRWNRELFFRSRYCSVHLNPDGSIADIYSKRISALSQDEIIEFTGRIQLTGKQSGWSNSYRYRVFSQENSTLIIILDASSALTNIFSILMITCSIGLILCIIIVITLILCAKYAVKPIVTAYEKQRQFITDAGHELKTPLTIIMANSEILELTYGEDEWITGIQRQSQMMKNLIHSLIQLAKLEGDPQTFPHTTLSFNELLDQSIQYFRSVSLQKDITLASDTPPGIKLSGNPDLLKQLVNILLDNAIKYSPEHSTIQVDVQSHFNHLTFSVSNPFKKDCEPDYSRLFDRFYRDDKSRTASDSHGLGLSIARSIVVHHHGKIHAYSSAPGLITLEVILPLRSSTEKQF